MLYALRHRTVFRYAHPVQFARCNLRLKPIDWPDQRLDAFTLDVSPAAIPKPVRGDGYPAQMMRIVIERPVSELVIESRARVHVDRTEPVTLPSDPIVAEVAEAVRTTTDLDSLSPVNYVYASPLIAPDPVIGAWCAESFAPDRGIVEAAYELTRRIQREFRYDADATETDTPPADAFARRTGVCQDFTQIMVSGLRALGLPAAYASGYLRTLPPPGGEKLVGADASHAWVMLWCGGRRGWLGFDPTNGCGMGQEHILAAMGRDYADISPIDGIFVGQEGQTIKVAVDVEPIEG